MPGAPGRPLLPPRSSALSSFWRGDASCGGIPSLAAPPRPAGRSAREPRGWRRRRPSRGGGGVGEEEEESVPARGAR
ncbi:unnamed protein product [Diplocarpon coronariae]